MSELDNTFEEFDKKDIDDNIAMAVLAYFGILVLIPILAAKESKYARYHANQGLILFITSTIANAILVVISISSTVISALSLNLLALLIGTIIPVLISVGIGILMFALMIIGIINAATGKAKQLPVIGKFTILK